jgi:ABC-2 type transport system ATP-binding protein
VILSTHILSEVSSICDRVIVIDKGRILASQSLTELRVQLQRTRTVRIEVEGPEAQVRSALEQLSGVESVKRVGLNGANGSEPATLSFVIEHQGDDIRKQASKTIMENGWGLLEVRSLEPTLEDLYLQLIRETELSH